MTRRLVALVGPTAAGKTAVSLDLAREFGMEVVNADSRQIYRGMDIGTAKPLLAERAIVPHHLFDIADPAESFSLALYKRAAAEVIEGIHERGATPLLVGGTGQYVWAVLEDWKIPEVAPDLPFREARATIARERGPAALHAELAAIDPTAASRIQQNNVRRVIRALEVFHATGVPISVWQEKGDPPFAARILGIDAPNEVLFERIDRRVDEMFEAGFIGEVAALLAAGGLPRDAPAMSSIGYGEVAAFLGGEISQEEASGRTKLATRQLVRKQRQWFRKTDERITWVGGAAEARALVLSFLG